MGGCLCLRGMVPLPASKYPGKRYNILVPDIFPIKPPRVDEDLKPAVTKKIEKLGEYVTNNPQRASKVSRRLDRRIRKEASKKEPQLGYIKIAIHAYTYLLAQKVVNLYALELIRRENPLIEILLKHQNVHLRILSAELLAHFLRQQNDTDNLTALHALIPMLSWNCRRETPNELVNVEEKSILELRVACLRGLREHVGLMHRLSADPKHLDIIMASVLDNLDCVAGVEEKEEEHFSTKPIDISPPKPSSPVQLLRNISARKQLDRQKSTSIDFRFFQRCEIPDEFAHASTPSLVASQVISELGSLTKAAGNAEKVLQCLLHQLDERNKWSDVKTVCTLFDMMRDAYARHHQQFLLFTVVLRHAAGASCLPARERTSLIQLAINEGLTQDVHLTVSVLVHCLAYLPSLLPLPASKTREQPDSSSTSVSNHHSSHGDSIKSSLAGSFGSGEILAREDSVVGSLPDEMLRDAILHGFKQIAGQVEDSIQLIDALLGVVGRFNCPFAYGDWTPIEEVCVLECVVASAEAIFTFPKEELSLPHQKYEQALQELCIMHCCVSTNAKVHVHRLLQLILDLSPVGEYTLPQSATTRIMSVLYHGAMDPNATPPSFAAIYMIVKNLLEQSGRPCAFLALQFGSTLWHEALKQAATHHPCLSATHKCAILILCKSMMSSIGSMLGIAINPEQWLPGLNAVVRPSLKLEGPHLVSSSSTFGTSLEDSCELVIANAQACEGFAHAIESSLKENKDILYEFAQEPVAVASLKFVPESVLSIKNTTKLLPIQNRTSAQSSLSENDFEMHARLQEREPCGSDANASRKGRTDKSVHAARNAPKDEKLEDSAFGSPAICTLEEILELIDKTIDASSCGSDEGLDFMKLSVGVEGVIF